MSADDQTQQITFRPAWGLDDATVVRDAKEFWRTLRNLRPAEIDRRANEICAAAYEGGKLVGIGTAYIAELPMLKARFAFYRTTVESDHRRQHISYRLAAFSRGVLERWSAERPLEKVVGMCAEIQAAQYKEKQREPTWPEYGLNLNLVGYNSFGEQVRVSWFAHARL